MQNCVKELFVSYVVEVSVTSLYTFEGIGRMVNQDLNRILLMCTCSQSLITDHQDKLPGYKNMGEEASTTQMFEGYH